jgi:DNA-nicking Smr family endonuclease
VAGSCPDEELDENELFAAAMGPVQPIARTPRVSAKRARPPRAGQCVRSGRAAVVVQDSRRGRAHTARPTAEPWVLLADGVSRERLKQLAAGRPPIGRTFDLHGMTREQALATLGQGCEQADSDGVRVICIVHGRGLHSQGRPVLKEAVYHWLRHGALAHRVLAVTPQPGSGGGACLLLLRRRPSNGA